MSENRLNQLKYMWIDVIFIVKSYGWMGLLKKIIDRNLKFKVTYRVVFIINLNSNPNQNGFPFHDRIESKLLLVVCELSHSMQATNYEKLS